jgi:Peptidase_C39 like family
LWNRVLAVPECSQMVYPDGGEVWCSPTSTSMVLAYWQTATGPCEPRVRAAVDGVFDWIYDGHGNWPFNTAYAASQGLEGYVARFTSMAQLEPWIAAGVPVVISYAWKKNELTGAPIPSSNGHLAVLAGFDAAGNPVVNDPAAPSDDTVQRTYLRSELERLWLETSGGTAYLIYPQGRAVPVL